MKKFIYLRSKKDYMKNIIIFAIVLTVIAIGCSEEEQDNTFEIESDIIQQAVASLDASKCNSISNEFLRNDCFVGVAGGTGNEELCENIAEELTKDECIRQAKIHKLPEDKKICEKASGYEKSACYTRLAVEKNESSYCEYIKLEEFTYGNRGNCYIRYISEYGSIEMCNEYFSEESWKNSCYFSLAVQQQNGSICNIMSNTIRKVSCNSQIN